MAVLILTLACVLLAPFALRRYLDHKRRAITDLRNQRVIDDIVLRELQSEMDLEEVQLLDPTESG